MVEEVIHSVKEVIQLICVDFVEEVIHTLVIIVSAQSKEFGFWVF